MRKWIALGVVSALLIVGLVGFATWHRARFQATVLPRSTPSLSECMEGACQQAVRFPWFHISIRNTRHATGYAYCWAHGYSRSGETVSRVGVPLGALGPGWPYLAPGQSVQGDWYFQQTPSGPVDDYTAGCWRISNDPAIP